MPSALFHTLPTVADGLALEMDMLQTATATGASLAVMWEARTRALVLPERFTREVSFEPAARSSDTRGWPVVARKSGGGITPQGPGVLNVALCFSLAPHETRSITGTYGRIVTPLERGFAALGVTAAAMPVAHSFCDGDYNLAVDGRKIVGTAQRWRGKTCLIHALILTHIDLAPAVAAVAGFSDELGHDTKFKTLAHCRLADLLPDGSDVGAMAIQAFEKAVTRAGYASF